MRFKFLIAFNLLAVVYKAAVNAQSGDGDFKCPSSGFYRNPEDCSSFYSCRKKVAEKLFCSDGLNFNDRRKNCDHADTAFCEEPFEESDQPEEEGTPSDDVKCPSVRCNCVYPSQKNCFEYYRCHNGTAYLERCSDGLLLNPVTFICDFKDNVICEGRSALSSDIEGSGDDESETPEKTVLTKDTEQETTTVADSETDVMDENESDELTNENFIVLTNSSSNTLNQGFELGTENSSFSNQDTFNTFNEEENITEQVNNTAANEALDDDSTSEDSAEEDASTVSPEPECSCNRCRTPDKDDCSKYFECINGKLISKECEDDLLFNPVKNACDIEDNVECPKSDMCIEESGFFPDLNDCSAFVVCKKNYVADRRMCPEGLFYNAYSRICDNSSSSKCGDLDYQPMDPKSRDFSVVCECESCIAPDSDDCTKYYLCLNNMAYSGNCEEGLLFNAKVSNCDFPQNVICTNSSPECTKPNGVFPDPKECSSYYHCIGGVSHKHHCNDDLHFNPEKGICEAPCDAQCDKSAVCSTTSDTEITEESVEDATENSEPNEQAFTTQKTLSTTEDDLEEEIFERIFPAKTSEEIYEDEVLDSEESEHGMKNVNETLMQDEAILKTDANVDDTEHEEEEERDSEYDEEAQSSTELETPNESTNTETENLKGDDNIPNSLKGSKTTNAVFYDEENEATLPSDSKLEDTETEYDDSEITPEEAVSIWTTLADAISSSSSNWKDSDSRKVDERTIDDVSMTEQETDDDSFPEITTIVSDPDDSNLNSDMSKIDENMDSEIDEDEEHSSPSNAHSMESDFQGNASLDYEDFVTEVIKISTNDDSFDENENNEYTDLLATNEYNSATYGVTYVDDLIESSQNLSDSASITEETYDDSNEDQTDSHSSDSEVVTLVENSPDAKTEDSDEDEGKDVTSEISNEQPKPRTTTPAYVSEGETDNELDEQSSEIASSKSNENEEGNITFFDLRSNSRGEEDETNSDNVAAETSRNSSNNDFNSDESNSLSQPSLNEADNTNDGNVNYERTTSLSHTEIMEKTQDYSNEAEISTNSHKDIEYDTVTTEDSREELSLEIETELSKQTGVYIPSSPMSLSNENEFGLNGTPESVRFISENANSAMNEGINGFNEESDDAVRPTSYEYDTTTVKSDFLETSDGEIDSSNYQGSDEEIVLGNDENQEITVNIKMSTRVPIVDSKPGQTVEDLGDGVFEKIFPSSSGATNKPGTISSIQEISSKSELKLSTENLNELSAKPMITSDEQKQVNVIKEKDEQTNKFIEMHVSSTTNYEFMNPTIETINKPSQEVEDKVIDDSTYPVSKKPVTAEIMNHTFDSLGTTFDNYVTPAKNEEANKYVEMAASSSTTYDFINYPIGTNSESSQKVVDDVIPSLPQRIEAGDIEITRTPPSTITRVNIYTSESVRTISDNYVTTAKSDEGGKYVERAPSSSTTYDFMNQPNKISESNQDQAFNVVTPHLPKRTEAVDITIFQTPHSTVFIANDHTSESAKKLDYVTKAKNEEGGKYVEIDAENKYFEIKAPSSTNFDFMNYPIGTKSETNQNVVSDVISSLPKRTEAGDIEITRTPPSTITRQNVYPSESVRTISENYVTTAKTEEAGKYVEMSPSSSTTYDFMNQFNKIISESNQKVTNYQDGVSNVVTPNLPKRTEAVGVATVPSTSFNGNPPFESDNTLAASGPMTDTLNSLRKVTLAPSNSIINENTTDYSETIYKTTEKDYLDKVRSTIPDKTLPENIELDNEKTNIKNTLFDLNQPELVPQSAYEYTKENTSVISTTSSTHSPEVVKIENSLMETFETFPNISLTASLSNNESTQKCDSEGTVLTNELNCQTFYQCVSGTFKMMRCPDGFHFSALTSRCEFPCDAKCDKKLVCYAETTTLGIPVQFKYCTQDGLFPIPEDCSKYLNCSGNLSLVQSCSKGLHFNVTTRTCDWPALAKCGSLPGRPNGHSTRCHKKFYLKSLKSDCSKYHLCLDKRYYKLECSPGLLFDNATSRCSFASEVKCGQAPRPPVTLTTKIEKKFICKKRNGLFKSPDDCGFFMQCFNGRPHLMHCPSNLHFNEHRKICDYPCQAKCDKTLVCSTPAPSHNLRNELCTCDNCQLPSPDSCDRFMQCQNGRLRWRRCSHGKLFDRVRKVCDWANKVFCPFHIQCPRLEGLFEYRGDCHKFIHCSNGIPYIKSCPDGLEFNTSNRRCEWHTGRCTHQNDSMTEYLVSNPMCPTPDGYFAYGKNCSGFVHCVRNRPIIRACPPNLMFNSDLNVCDWPKNVKCGDRQEMIVRQCLSSEQNIRCFSERIRVPHEHECSLFYDCSTGLSCLRRCPAGLVFDSVNMFCDVPERSNCTIKKSDEGQGTRCNGRWRITADVRNERCFFRCINNLRLHGCCKGNKIFDKKVHRCRNRPAHGYAKHSY